jgi:hypothetical protein
MKSLLAWCLPAVLLVGLVCNTGCRVPEERVAQTPLDPDPEFPEDHSGWWSNGTQVLRLDAGGQYVMYGSAARLDPPLHRGGWLQPTHGRITLEPYTDIEVEDFDVEVTSVDGVYELRVPGYEPFRRMDDPPPPPRPQPRHPRRPMSNTA